MNHVRGWFSAPNTPPAPREADLGPPPPPSGEPELSVPLVSPAADESNVLGLSISSSPNTSTNDVSAVHVNDSSSSLGLSSPKLESQPRIVTPGESKPPSTKPTIRERLSTLARRSTFKSKPPISPIAQQESPAGGKLNHLQTHSEPTIQAIRASPEDPTLTLADDTRKGRPLERHLLGSSASSPRPEHPKLPHLRKSPARSSTSPIPSHVNVDLPHTRKRLIVCCDGTWHDGISQTRRWRYSNVLKLSRCIDHEDARTHPPTPQIIFYQSGLGTQDNIISQLVDGAFGVHLAEKVQEVYAWVAQNYCPGDEIFLFGFSRGAYTVRMVAMFIGEIGLLSRSEMDNFANIFIAYQKKGKTTDLAERKKYDEVLAPYQRDGAYGKSKFTDKKFSIKVVGVFDTVGALGLPAEFTRSPKISTLFGFADKILPEHIERAYHAMALDEERADFNVTKFYQTPEAKANGQHLRQMWFSGSHSDVGGGFQDHDISDVALVWMVAEIEGCLAIDLKYLKALPRPVKPWGMQGPHYSKNGFFALGSSAPRTIEPTNHETCERIHLSVTKQVIRHPHIDSAIEKHPTLVERLLPLEEEIIQGWVYKPGNTPPRQDTARAREEQRREKKALDAIRDATRKAAKRGKTIIQNMTASESEGEARAATGDDDAGIVGAAIRRATTLYEESAVAPVWDEINREV